MQGYPSSPTYYGGVTTCYYNDQDLNKLETVNSYTQGYYARQSKTHEKITFHHSPFFRISTLAGYPRNTQGGTEREEPTKENIEKHRNYMSPHDRKHPYFEDPNHGNTH